MMLEQRDLEEAMNDANAGLDKCETVMEFMRRRQAIEEEYTRSLKKLCTSVNVKQVKHGGLLCFGGRTVIEEADESNSEYVRKSSLWRAFYDIVEDTSQEAKGHGMLAETIRSQLIEPLEKSIKSMQLSKRTIQADLDMLSDESTEAHRQYQKCKKAVDKADIAAQSAHQKLEAATTQAVVNPQHADRLRLHVQKADDAADLCRSHLRQAEERVRTLTARHHATELPRVLQSLRRLESQRSYDVFKAVHGLVAAVRVAGEVVAGGVEEMGQAVLAVDITGDLQRYDDIYGGEATPQMQRIDTADSNLIK